MQRGERMRNEYPALQVNLDAIRQNARVLCGLCRENGISVAGVIKFSDGSPAVGKAYLEGGCAQLAVSRARHLQGLKEALPEAELLLTRAPTRGELEAAARWADLILLADADLLRALDEEAKVWGTRPGVILMLDVGDLREGVDNIPELVELAVLAESLPNLRLRGVGTNHACLNGVLPTWENLSFLIEGAEAVEQAIGRPLELISGGSSINLLLLRDWVNKMPPRINHLRLGGTIANPMNIRLGRGLTFEGLREDSMLMAAEIVDLHEKASAPKGESTKNWAGETVTQQDKGRRLRAILALGSQDIGSHTSLIPLEEGAELVGCSSDHTIVDVTDTGKTWKTGDVLQFRVRYSAMLYAFTGQHVRIEYLKD
jgi:predicted amino acid racemase